MKKAFLVVGVCFVLGNSLDAQTQLKFWIDSSSEPPEREVFKQLVADYNQKHPDVQIKYEVVPGTETDATKLMTAVRSGAGPDVYLLDRFTVAERAASGLLTDLTPFIRQEKADLSSKYLAFAWQETLYQNKVYALPLGTDVRVLFYNKTLLKQSLIDPAQFDPAKGPMSFERIKEIAFKLNRTDASGAYTTVGFIPWLEQGWGYTWGFACGGNFFDPKNCKITCNDPGVIEGYQFLYDYAKALGPQKAKTFVDTYWQWPRTGTLPDQQEPFITGKVAMVINGQWFIPIIKAAAPNLDYGMTYIPAPDGRKTTWSGGWSFVIPQGSKHPDAAYAFMRYLTSDGSQTALAKGASTLPTLRSLVNRTDLFPPEYQFLLSLLPSSRSRPPLPVGAQYWDQLKEAEEAVIANSQSPQNALQTVVDTVQPKMDRFCK